MYKFGLYNPNDYAQEKGYAYVTSPEIFIKGKLKFDPNGLFSEVIWPQSDNSRFEKKAIIDLRTVGAIVHPKFLSILKSHSKTLYNAVIGSGYVNLVKNEIVKDDKKGYQGLPVIKLLIDNLNVIQNLHGNIHTILKGYKYKVLIDSIFVLPPALRDIIVKEGKIINNPVINTYYQKLIKSAVAVDYKRDHLLELDRMSYFEYSKWYNIQSLVYKIYKLEQDELKSKQGFIRQKLLGKRVDFSGRTVASVNPHLPHDTISVPYKMGAKLFEPYIGYIIFTEQPELKSKLQSILKRPVTEASFPNEMKLFREGYYPSEAERIIKEILDKKIANKYPLVMKRDPGLHRMSLQGFNVVFNDTHTIQVPPMVTGGYNLDFDGDSIVGDVTLKVRNKKTGKVTYITSNIMDLKDLKVEAF